MPEAPWIGKLLDPLNRFLTGVRALLANGLSFADNFNAEVRTLDVTTRDDWTPLVLQSGWTAFDVAYTPKYRHIGTEVEVVGLAKGGSWGIGTLVASLPPAVSTLSFAVPASAAYAYGAIQIDAFGDLKIGAAPDSTMLSLAIRYAAKDVGPANGAFPVKWKSKVRGKVTGIVILRAVEVRDRAEKPVLCSPFPDWSQDGENTIISGVAGLTGGKTYRLTVVAFGGG